MEPTPEALLFRGSVAHTRLGSVRHHFRYASFSLLIELGAIDDLARSLTLLSHNRPNLYALYDRDFGPRDGSPLEPWARERLRSAGIDVDGGRIRLLCYPRVAGYAFNPLAIWFAHDRDGRLRAVIYEVSNTFGEWHHYLMPVSGQAAEAGGVLRHRCAKQFHVSPFIGMEAAYDFTLRDPRDRLSVMIRETGPDGPIMIATQSGRPMPLTDRSLARLALAMPLHGLKVIGAIHWQALRLWLKGARFRRNPGRADARLTIAGHDANATPNA